MLDSEFLPQKTRNLAQVICLLIVLSLVGILFWLMRPHPKPFNQLLIGEWQVTVEGKPDGRITFEPEGVVRVDLSSERRNGTYKLLNQKDMKSLSMRTLPNVQNIGLFDNSDWAKILYVSIINSDTLRLVTPEPDSHGITVLTRVKNR